MSDPTVPACALEAARKRGAVSHGQYRVVVLESRGGLTVTDLANLKAAMQYANDAAAEADLPPALAYVFDDALHFVDRGRHYGAC